MVYNPDTESRPRSFEDVFGMLAMGLMVFNGGPRSMPAEQRQDEKRKRKPTLGTFGGVFVPSILTILGIILFRRLGYVVGAAGLAYALIIIAFASIISILTSISLAAVATNFKVGPGGPYYLISRTLGVEFGGAIGVVLFLAPPS